MLTCDVVDTFMPVFVHGTFITSATFPSTGRTTGGALGEAVGEGTDPPLTMLPPPAQPVSSSVIAVEIRKRVLVEAMKKHISARCSLS
jgi:hypothetical protein